MNNFILSEKYKKIHFVGIGGISMSALSKYCVANGFKVSGSDKILSPETRLLSSLGVKIFEGHNEKNVKGADLVVYTSAIDKDNPELKYAMQNGIPVIKRSELLGAIANLGKSIAVSGSHGKTTTTAMISEIFINAGKNPTVFLGGEARFGNFRIGESKITVLEACEYKKNFLDISPCLAVVLNVDNDHLDSYKDLQDEIATFTKFIQNGIAVVNADDKNAKTVFNSATVNFGIENSAPYRAKNIKDNGMGFSFSVFEYGKYSGRINLKIAGYHNIYNALAAISVARINGIPFNVCKSTLEDFKGVKRRNEFIGTYNGKKCFADYAHHPTEIKAVLSCYKDKNLLAVFQPHTYSRTKLLKKEFTEVLAGVKNIIIYKTYPARENFDALGDAFALYNELNENKNIKVSYSDSEKDLKERIEKYEKIDTVLFIGAGDIYEIAEGIIKKAER